MLGRMKTTLNLDDELLSQAKQEAHRRGKTLTAFLTEALQAALTEPAGPAVRFKLRLPTIRGDGPPFVDPADRAALFDVLDGRTPGDR
jgi:Bacterial antitoxin of type II TA system, VapB